MREAIEKVIAELEEEQKRLALERILKWDDDDKDDIRAGKIQGIIFAKEKLKAVLANGENAND